MHSEIKVAQRFKFNALSDNPPIERTAVVTRVLSDKEEGLKAGGGILFCILGGSSRTSRNRASDDVAVSAWN